MKSRKLVFLIVGALLLFIGLSNVPVIKQYVTDLSVSTVPGEEKATFFSLVKNDDFTGIIKSIKSVEQHFNKRYKYDWVILTTDDLDEEFKDSVSRLCSGIVKFGRIDEWRYPEWIDIDKVDKAREAMWAKRIMFGDSVEFRHKSRFLSGFFYKHELTQDYDWYWRIDPNTQIYCDINYDIFEYMRLNGKKFSFTISIPEYEPTIPTLWDTARAFIETNGDLIAKDNLIEFISQDDKFNGCHFWSLQIGSLNFWRDETYSKFFEKFDKEGGIYYERWSEYVIQSIAVSLLLSRDEVHFIDDFGYDSGAHIHCPIDETIRIKNKCLCSARDEVTWKGFSCIPRYFDIQNLTRPANWEMYSFY